MPALSYACVTVFVLGAQLNPYAREADQEARLGGFDLLTQRVLEFLANVG